MGKRLIIKNADFSKNAIYSEYEWQTMSTAKPTVIGNPSNTAFGTLMKSTSPNYSVYIRNISTINVPSGKKLIAELINNTTGRQNNTLWTSLYYQEAWEMSPIPETAFPAESIDYSASPQPLRRYEWDNNLGKDVDVMFSIGVEGVSTLVAKDYYLRYAVVDIEAENES